MKSISKIKKSIRYISGPHCSIDWVAGGNFDGYVYELSLYFTSDKEVIYERKIIDNRWADDKPKEFAINGRYYSSDKAAFICEFPFIKMRCVIIGDEDEYIAVSVAYEKHPQNGVNLVFEKNAQNTGYDDHTPASHGA